MYWVILFFLDWLQNDCVEQKIADSIGVENLLAFKDVLKLDWGL